MKRSNGLCLFISAIVVIFSCMPPYLTEYRTHLLNSDPKSLVFKDSLFIFEFHPVPNGLYFNITNLSNVPAKLEWNSCYFIDPTGNPSRALNIDGIIEDTRSREMASNESIIPPNGSFGRFTTSALNVREIKSSSTDFYYFKSIGYGFSYTTQNTFYKYGRFWPDYKGPVFDPTDSLHKKDIALPNISSYVRKNNNLGIGFCIRIKDTTVDYKFEFKINNIAIYKSHDSSSVLLFTANDSSDWNWKKAPIPVPVLLAPLNGTIIDTLPVNLQWNKPIGVAAFHVQISADSLFQSLVSVDTAKIWPSKSLFKLKDNFTYYWRVSAKCKDGQSAWTAPFIFTTNLKKKIAR